MKDGFMRPKSENRWKIVQEYARRSWKIMAHVYFAKCGCEKIFNKPNISYKNKRSK